MQDVFGQRCFDLQCWAKRFERVNVKVSVLNYRKTSSLRLTSFKGTIKWSELDLRTSILDSFLSCLGFSSTILSELDGDTPNAFDDGATKADAVGGAHANAKAVNWNFMLMILNC